MKIFLIGANGQLGTDLRQLLKTENIQVVPFTHRELDIRDAETTARAIESHRPDFVINTAAFHKVEECEKQPAVSFEVNAIAVMNLAKACKQAGCVLVHFSTDYVFDGSKRRPYDEDDLPHPLNVYAVSKVAGELMIPFNTEAYFIVRTCGLYGVAGSSGKGGNFVETMLKKAAEGSQLRVVNDQVLTPTFTADLAQAVLRLIRSKRYGLYHLSSEGKCSWYEFASKIFELENIQVDLVPVTTDQFASPVKRPSYSVLGKMRAKDLGIVMPPWQEGLQRYLQARRAKTNRIAGALA